jgi:hypothetical protein
LERGRVNFVVLTDDVSGYLFPFISLDRIILFDVVTGFSLKCFHIVGFCYFEFHNVFVDDAFMGFFIREGVGDNLDEKYVTILVSGAGGHGSFDVASEILHKAVFKLWFQ